MKAHDARRQLNVIDERLLGREVISSTELLINERTLCEQTCFWRPRLFICISAPVLQNTDTISLSLSLSCFLFFFKITVSNAGVGFLPPSVSQCASLSLSVERRPVSAPGSCPLLRVGCGTRPWAGSREMSTSREKKKKGERVFRACLWRHLVLVLALVALKKTGVVVFWPVEAQRRNEEVRLHYPACGASHLPTAVRFNEEAQGRKKTKPFFFF